MTRRLPGIATGSALVQAEDTPLEAGKRWVLMAPNRSAETRILLAEARGDVQRQAIGHQSGGRVFLFLHTDDFKRDYAASRRAASPSERRARSATASWRCSRISTATNGICCSRRRERRLLNDLAGGRA